MGLPDILFYVFAALTLLCGVLVVANPFSRNPVTSAMFLVLTIISMAGLFVLLHAFFLAAVQVLVYAGAVMVLFLFVIMLLDLKEEERRKINKLGLVAGLISVGAITLNFVKSLYATQTGRNLPTPTWARKARPSRSASCCLRITCCRLKSFPSCSSWRWLGRGFCRRRV
jgi:NADH-quinone oxidoreductase subunit J